MMGFLLQALWFIFLAALVVIILIVVSRIK